MNLRRLTNPSHLKLINLVHYNGKMPLSNRMMIFNGKGYRGLNYVSRKNFGQLQAIRP